MKAKSNAKVGDRVVYVDQPKTFGVIIELHDKEIINKDVKVHWGNAPEGKNIHRNGRGSYNLENLKLMRI